MGQIVWFVRAAALALIAVTFLACKTQPLPEEGAPSAQLYREKCGRCHAPYLPSTMTSAMWETELPMMEIKMHQAGIEPLTDGEREALIAYLKRNAGTE